MMTFKRGQAPRLRRAAGAVLGLDCATAPGMRALVPAEVSGADRRQLFLPVAVRLMFDRVLFFNSFIAPRLLRGSA